MVNDDEVQSISGYSDLRSQASRRSGYGRGNIDNQSQYNVDLFQNIIEEEDENEADEEDQIEQAIQQSQEERKSIRSLSEGGNGQGPNSSILTSRQN